MTSLSWHDFVMSEAELFAAYRNATGWEAECDCGDRIYSQLGTPAAVEEAVRLHQGSTVHAHYRAWQEAVAALRRPVRRHCPCHEHGAP